MLLVADDANAAYSKSTPAAKVRADSPAVYPFTLPHLAASGCRVLFDSKNTSTRVGTGTNATLDDMGYRGEDVSTPRGAWERQPPWQSSTDDYQAADSGGAGYGPGDGYPGQGQPGHAGYAGYGPQDEQYGGP